MTELFFKLIQDLHWKERQLFIKSYNSNIFFFQWWEVVQLRKTYICLLCCIPTHIYSVTKATVLQGTTTPVVCHVTSHALYCCHKSYLSYLIVNSQPGVAFRCYCILNTFYPKPELTLVLMDLLYDFYYPGTLKETCLKNKFFFHYFLFIFFLRTMI